MIVQQVLVGGTAEGEILQLDEPVSFWGGVDSRTGVIVDASHPQVGECVTGRILVMPHARGSSGTSSGLTELIRTSLGPAGIVLGSRDSMVMVGALVGARLYGRICPIVVTDPADDLTGRWRIEGEILERSRG